MQNSPVEGEGLFTSLNIVGAALVQPDNAV